MQTTRQYLRAVRKACPTALRRRLMTDFKNSVAYFQEENPDCTVEDLIHRFGSPQQFTSEYIATLDQAAMKRLARRHCIIIGGVTILIIAMAILLTALYIHAVNELPPIHVWNTPQTISPPN